MPNILVVDESTFERVALAALLQKRLPDVTVRHLSSAPEALEILDSQTIDLIVTDLMIPGMNGCEFIREIRKQGFEFPIVLLTRFGTEQTAFEGLRAGATNYVPKRELDHILIPTVENALSRYQSSRAKAALRSYMTDVQYHLAIANDDSLMTPLIEYVQDQIRSMRLLAERDVIRLGIAMHEGLTNAILHGNFEVSSRLREQNETLFLRLVNERRQQIPFCQRDVFVHVALTETQIRISIRDQGPGFDVATVMEPNRLINLEGISGRGLLIMKSFSDVIYHNPTGNEVTMIKYVRTNTSHTYSESSLLSSMAHHTIPTPHMGRSVPSHLKF